MHTASRPRGLGAREEETGRNGLRQLQAFGQWWLNQRHSLRALPLSLLLVGTRWPQSQASTSSGAQQEVPPRTRTLLLLRLESDLSGSNPCSTLIS